MLKDTKSVIIHNIVSPYKTFLFNEIHKLYDNFKVLYVAETELNREWEINTDDLEFPYEILAKGPIDSFSIWTSVTMIWKRLNSLNPDVVIIGGYSHPCYWVTFFWAKANGKKIILWSGSNEEDKERFIFKEKLKSLFVSNCDAANTYGRRNENYLVKLGIERNRVFIKGNTTDNFFYYSETMKLKSRKEALCRQLGVPCHNFLYIGRYSEEKNLLRLLKAYGRLRRENYGWGLILVGNGSLKVNLARFIDQCSIKDVLLTGFKQKQDIPQYLAVSDTFILPSISEPWGLVVNEAMAAGLPLLISKNCGCYPDIVREGVNGFSFDPFDEEELYRLMECVVQGKFDLGKMGEASLDIIKEYTPERAAKVVIETLRFVLKR